MASYYELQIECNNTEKKKIEDLLHKSARDYQSGWYLIIEEGSKEYFQVLNKFISIVEDNLIALKEIGIKSEQISFWYMYEYEQQCNMEFDADVMKKMGNLGVTLCISCWEK